MSWNEIEVYRTIRLNEKEIKEGISILRSSKRSEKICHILDMFECGLSHIKENEASIFDIKIAYGIRDEDYDE